MTVFVSILSSSRKKSAFSSHYLPCMLSCWGRKETMSYSYETQLRVRLSIIYFDSKLNNIFEFVKIWKIALLQICENVAPNHSLNWSKSPDICMYMYLFIFARICLFCSIFFYPYLICCVRGIEKADYLSTCSCHLLLYN